MPDWSAVRFCISSITGIAYCIYELAQNSQDVCAHLLNIMNFVQLSVYLVGGTCRTFRVFSILYRGMYNLDLVCLFSLLINYAGDYRCERDSFTNFYLGQLIHVLLWISLHNQNDTNRHPAINPVVPDEIVVIN